MKIGITTFKGFKDGKVPIEADSKDDIEILNSQIRDKCGDRLETKVQKRRNLRLINYNILDEVRLENAEDNLCANLSTSTEQGRHNKIHISPSAVPNAPKRSCRPLRKSIALCERNGSSLLPVVMKSLSTHICTCINMIQA